MRDQVALAAGPALVGPGCLALHARMVGPVFVGILVVGQGSAGLAVSDFDYLGAGGLATVAQ